MNSFSPPRPTAKLAPLFLPTPLTKRTSFKLAQLVFGVVATGIGPVALAQGPGQLEELSPDTGWFLRLGGYVRTGVKLSLRDHLIPTGAVGDATVGYTYDNGFVKPDASGHPSDTWNWGYTGTSPESYTAVSQYTQGGNTLHFQQVANAPRVGTVDMGSQNLFGGQFTGGFEVSRFKIRKTEVKFGFEAGYAYSTISSSATRSAHSENATLTTDTYSLIDPLDGALLFPPASPYIGNPGGPGLILPRNPSEHSSVVSSGTATLDARMKASIHTLRVGPWFELPIAKRTSLGFSFGYATALVDANLQLRESTTYTDASILEHVYPDQNFRRSSWVPGAYGQLRATYMFTEHLGAYVGAEVQWSKNLQYSVRSREADIKFGATLGGALGLTLSY